MHRVLGTSRNGVAQGVVVADLGQMVRDHERLELALCRVGDGERIGKVVLLIREGDGVVIAVGAVRKVRRIDILFDRFQRGRTAALDDIDACLGIDARVLAVFVIQALADSRALIAEIVGQEYGGVDEFTVRHQLLRLCLYGQPALALRQQRQGAGVEMNGHRQVAVLTVARKGNGKGIVGFSVADIGVPDA